ncbi:Predicted DNA-binding protein, contains Ribbon-helix-helix (RHH) domain [Limimonas halophila]|uniref:Predicted DNA-binding protein, contains Ribbon-helix-helix (RHH) domain n=1 Tax=Limimonas halophila TaxID=1082479 RepID=A0A1G7RDJ5_9PROT|nr:Predicted DNA-binding protein, contains Ribbon-helix-helix (RHH) domain [Limimonas halophila]
MADGRDALSSALVSRNVTVNGRRTSLRLEPELWESLEEIARREGVTVSDIVAGVDAQRAVGGLTSAVRTFVLGYFRSAATERGHANAGHGLLFRLGMPPRAPA